jgi:hypothetical protein
MKKHITNKQKRKYLKEHGWIQLWSDDNWISKERYEKGDYNNPDWQGLSTEQAFEIEMEYGMLDTEEFKWGGKDITYDRLVKKVKDIQKKKETSKKK